MKHILWPTEVCLTWIPLLQAGEELFITYIESYLLSAPASRRSASLNRDFTCACTRCSHEKKTEDPKELQKEMRLHVRAKAWIEYVD